MQLSGRYEPYRLICRWLNVKRPGRCAPLGAQGVDTAYGFSYNAKIFRTTAFFPLFQHTAFYFPPSAAQMVSLSLQNGKRVAFFLLTSFSMLAFCKREHSALLLQSHWIARSRESVQDSCRPVKPCRDSHRLENGVAIFADSEQSSRPSPFSPERSCVWQLFHSFCILHRFL